MENKLVESIVLQKKLQKTNLAEFRIEKVIKKMISYVLCEKVW